MVSPGNEIPHQYSRIISSKTSHTDIHKIQRCQSNTSSSRQYCGLNIFDENGRYSKSENGRVGQGNLGISFEVGDHNYCRIPPKRIEFNSRLGISKHFGLLRVDAESSNFSESLPNKGFSRDRFVCIPSITSDTNLCCMETRSSQSCNRCISTELVTQTPVCFSPILHDSKSSQQNTQGASPQAHINNPSLDNTSLVSKDFEHVNQESYFAALEKGSSEKSQRGNSYPSSEQDSTTGSLCNFRARLQEEGISKAASDLISRSRGPDSNPNYESVWRKWASWCSRRKIDSFSSNINEILDYFTDLNKQRLQYRTINNYRSAISAFYEQIQEKHVGEHLRLCALLAGIFKSRHPQPKYCFI